MFFKNFNRTEAKLRQKIRQGFDDCVAEVVQQSGTEDTFFLGLIVQSAIANYYQSLKNDNSLKQLCQRSNIDYNSLLDEECRNALNKYLE